MKSSIIMEQRTYYVRDAEKRHTGICVVGVIDAIGRVGVGYSMCNFRLEKSFRKKRGRSIALGRALRNLHDPARHDYRKQLLASFDVRTQAYYKTDRLELAIRNLLRVRNNLEEKCRWNQVEDKSKISS